MLSLPTLQSGYLVRGVRFQMAASSTKSVTSAALPVQLESTMRVRICACGWETDTELLLVFFGVAMLSFLSCLLVCFVCFVCFVRFRACCWWWWWWWLYLNDCPFAPSPSQSLAEGRAHCARAERLQWFNYCRLAYQKRRKDKDNNCNKSRGAEAKGFQTARSNVPPHA